MRPIFEIDDFSLCFLLSILVIEECHNILPDASAIVDVLRTILRFFMILSKCLRSLINMFNDFLVRNKLSHVILLQNTIAIDAKIFSWKCQQVSV